MMSDADLLSLSDQIRSVCDDKWCVYVLWTTSSHLPLAVRMAEATGFTVKQVGVWVKMKADGSRPTTGLGNYLRNGHEQFLFCTRGSGAMKAVMDHTVNTVFFDRSPVGKVTKDRDLHSVKPESVQDALDRMYPDARKLELFARRHRPGWTCVGNEVDGKLSDPNVPHEDIRDALVRLRDA